MLYYRIGKLKDKLESFQGLEVKSPISLQKLLFSKHPKSDLTGCLIYITKKHLKRCVLTNGAAGKNRTCDPVITNDVLYH